MGTFWHDLRYGARLLARNPGFAVIAILTLALGIGGATAIFSVVNGVLLRPLPYPKPAEIVRVFEVIDPGRHAGLSDPDFTDLRRQLGSLKGLAEFNSDLEPVSVSSGSNLITVASVSRDFFQVMGVSPFLGHGFPADQLHVGGEPMALVSYGYWQRYLGGTRDFRSVHLTLSGHLATVVGVMPRKFNFPAGTDIWLPREIFPVDPYRTGHNWSGIARLKDGATLGQAQAEATAVAQRLRQSYGQQTDLRDVSLVPLQEQLVGSTRPALLILLGAVGLLLLVACANVANLLLAQAAGRRRELAVRVAFGASRLRLSGQFVAEALELCLAGGLLGLPVAIWGVKALLALAPTELPRAEDVGIHPAVLVFAVGLSLATAVGLGLFVALRASGYQAQQSLKGTERTQTGEASGHRLRLTLLGAQIAVTLILLIGAGLLARSYFRLLTVDPGFRTSRVATMDLLGVWPETPEAKTRLTQILNGLIGRLGAAPGIENVGVVSIMPLSGFSQNIKYLVLTGPETFTSNAELAQAYMALSKDPTRTGQAEYRVASTGYFQAMGIPLLRGRMFNHGDGTDSPNVAIVSQSFADKQWPGQNPVGKMIELENVNSDLHPTTIVGVVGDVHDRSLDSSTLPTLYLDYRQRLANNFTIVMHTTRSTAAAVPQAREIMQSIEPDLPVRFGTIEQTVANSVSDREFNMVLLGFFAATALLVALMGVYGVGSYLVAQRTKEIGIRMALGAESGEVVRMIASQGLRVILAGAAAGVAGALVLTRALENLLYEVRTADPATFVAVTVLVVAAGLLACYVPARRAAGVDPNQALRVD